jgi:hypothetical protein
MTLQSSDSPATGGTAITLDQSFPVAKAIFVGTGGNVSLVDSKGATVVYKNLPSGGILPVMGTKVTSANTTASDLVALYE